MSRESRENDFHLILLHIWTATMANRWKQPDARMESDIAWVVQRK